MIFVTGATGFLGKSIVNALVEQGQPVRILVRATSNYAEFEAIPNVELIIGDVRNPPSFANGLQGCQTVIHAAANFRFWGKEADFFATNVQGTENLLKAAVKAQVKRFIFTSTIAVIGQPTQNEPITENSIPRPLDPYQKSKYQAEKLILAEQHQATMEIIVLRLGALYGPGGRYAFNRLFFEEYLRGWPIQVAGGRHIIFPCFIEDATQGCLLAIEQGRSGQIYNISGPSLSHKDLNDQISQEADKSNWRLNMPKWVMISAASLLEVIAVLTGKEPFYPLNLRHYVFQDWVVDSSKAKTELGFQPTPLDLSIRKTLAWYKELGLR